MIQPAGPTREATEACLTKAIDDLAYAMQTAEAMRELYDENPTRENKIGLFAANRLLKTAIACAEEWRS